MVQYIPYAYGCAICEYAYGIKSAYGTIDNKGIIIYDGTEQLHLQKCDMQFKQIAT